MTLLEQIAQQRTNEVIYTSVSLTIEKIATEAARDILRDPAFKSRLKAIAEQSVARAFRDLHNGQRAGTKARKTQKAKRR